MVGKRDHASRNDTSGGCLKCEAGYEIQSCPLLNECGSNEQEQAAMFIYEYNRTREITV